MKPWSVHGAISASSPLSERPASYHPQNRFSWFHSLSPWRTITILYLDMVLPILLSFTNYYVTRGPHDVDLARRKTRIWSAKLGCWRSITYTPTLSSTSVVLFHHVGGSADVCIYVRYRYTLLEWDCYYTGAVDGPGGAGKLNCWEFRNDVSWFLRCMRRTYYIHTIAIMDWKSIIWFITTCYFSNENRKGLRAHACFSWFFTSTRLLTSYFSVYSAGMLFKFLT